MRVFAAFMVSVAAAAGLGLAVPAAALPVATVDGRTSVVFVDYAGGFAITGDHGSDGSSTPMQSLTPSSLVLDGQHTFDGGYLSWSVTYTVNWELSQNYTIDSATHSISAQGLMHLDESSAVIGPNCNPCSATVAIGGTNTQQIEFSLSEATAYQLHGETTLGQWVNLAQWNDHTQRWQAMWSGPLFTQGKVFDLGGNLAQGRYQLSTSPYTFVADGVPPVQDNAWNYVLTLPGAEVTAVPEPARASLLVSGLAVVLFLRRRRGSTRPTSTRPRDPLV